MPSRFTRRSEPIEIGLADVVLEPPPILTRQVTPAPLQLRSAAIDYSTRPDPADDERTMVLEGIGMGKVALVADPDPEVRGLLSAVLCKIGCLVLEASDGNEALGMIRDAAPDLIVLEAMLPGMPGFEVCRAVRDDPALGATRIVLCSTIFRETVASDAQRAYRADACVEKPLRIDELKHLFESTLVGSTPTATAGRAPLEESALWKEAAEALNRDQAERAATLARSAIAKNPRAAEAHYYLGRALVKQGQILEAIAAYLRSAELRPDVAAVYVCLAQAYEHVGFHNSAREAWTRALATCDEPTLKRTIQARLVDSIGRA